MKRLVLLRHGLTPWNAQRRYQGHADIELDPVGLDQALAAAKAIADYAPTTVWTSDLLRAVQTAELVAEATELVPVVDPRLREIHVGELQGLSHVEVVGRFGGGPRDFGPFGGESEAELVSRMGEVFDGILDALEDGETAVVVSHGHAIRAGIGAFLGWSAEVYSGLGGLDNCGWVILTDERGERRLRAYNRTAD